MGQDGFNLDISVSAVLTMVNDVGLTNVFGLSGIMFNAVSALVFFRQGLNVSVNIIYFSLSIIDIFSIVFCLWRSFCMNPLKELTGLPLNFNEVKYLTGGWPAESTFRITSWLTLYIAVERVLSVVTPMKIKLILTARMTAINIACICLVNVVWAIPKYVSLNIDWKFFPEQNRTLLGWIRTGRIPLISDLEFTVHAWTMIAALAAMVVSTAILTAKLKHQSKWRKSLSGNFTGSGRMGVKQRRTIALIVAFTSAMIFFHVPDAGCTVMSLVWPDFLITGSMTNLTNACWSVSYLSHVINSNVNIFLFARMSSKYRNTLKSVFYCCWWRCQYKQV